MVITENRGKGKLCLGFEIDVGNFVHSCGFNVDELQRLMLPLLPFLMSVDLVTDCVKSHGTLETNSLKM